MSAETREWLSKNVLVGFVSKRQHAWHWREGDGNHYDGAIPVVDVNKRLFDWEAVPTEVYTRRGGEYVPVEGKRAITTSDTGEVLGIFTDGYQPHQYSEWLIDNVSTLLDGDLQIASAGLLRNRGVAWVQVEMPENLEHHGVSFRPFLTAATSLDGTLSTTYQRGVTAVVCDNSLSAAMAERTERVKIKHTKNSLLRIADAREALQIVFQAAESFMANLDAMVNYEVSMAEWQKMLEVAIPTKGKEKRALTMATTKRETIEGLYATDSRVTPWAGTAFGVLQAFNTYNIHLAPVRGGERAERVMMASLTGKLAEADNETLSLLQGVTGRVLV